MRDTQSHLGNKFLNISKFSPRRDTHYFTWPASPHILSRIFPSLSVCHAKLRAMV